MNLLASAVLLGSFVVLVDALSGDASDLASRFGGLFRNAELSDWPAGIQEGDAVGTGRSSLHKPTAADPGPEVLDSQAIVIVEEGLAPVPVSVICGVVAYRCAVRRRVAPPGRE